jgi:hypothetical protein
MTSRQFEELCRYFLAHKLQMPIELIQRVELIGAQRPRGPKSPKYHHQIDLHWKILDPVTACEHVANAKWRTPPGKLDQQDVLLVQKVREKVGAHKAMLLTNFGFTDGAVAVAEDEGVALHVVSPQFDTRLLTRSSADAIQKQLQQIAKAMGTEPIYLHQIIRKSFSAGDSPPQPEE